MKSTFTDEVRSVQEITDRSKNGLDQKNADRSGKPPIDIRVLLSIWKSTYTDEERSVQKYTD
jgi:hypothetical protein